MCSLVKHSADQTCCFKSTRHVSLKIIGHCRQASTLSFVSHHRNQIHMTRRIARACSSGISLSRQPACFHRLMSRIALSMMGQHKSDRRLSQPKSPASNHVVQVLYGKSTLEYCWQMTHTYRSFHEEIHEELRAQTLESHQPGWFSAWNPCSVARGHTPSSAKLQFPPSGAGPGSQLARLARWPAYLREAIRISAPQRQSKYQPAHQEPQLHIAPVFQGEAVPRQSPPGSMRLPMVNSHPNRCSRSHLPA